MLFVRGWLAHTPLKIRRRTGRGRKVAILGGGVGGLIAAYELLKAGYRCTVIEANPKVGGRSLTLRHGDVLREVLPDGRQYLDTGQTSSRQVCRFQPEDAIGWDRPYLNAGPGRLTLPNLPKQTFLALDFGGLLAGKLIVVVLALLFA